MNQIVARLLGFQVSDSNTPKQKPDQFVNKSDNATRAWFAAKNGSYFFANKSEYWIFDNVDDYQLNNLFCIKGNFTLHDQVYIKSDKGIKSFHQINHNQKIIFGPPGTGKSYSVDEIAKNLCITEPACRIQTVFHPEYTYGDFIAKLMPISNGGTVEYRVVAGHFIKALAQALKEPTQSVLLQIDEINRGNCAAIFGDIFQLLDRDSEGNSSYKVHLSELAITALEQEMGVGNSKLEEIKTSGAYIPKNLSIVATMNTSDESVYFMDSAFKRRWQFKYIDADHGADDTNSEQVSACVKYNADNHACETSWNCLRESINLFMIDNAKTIRGIEDKQIGLWFVKAKDKKIDPDDIKYKLMHYLWDNVFARDKKPLRELLVKNEAELATFGQFVTLKDAFVTKVLTKCTCEKPECTNTTTA